MKRMFAILLGVLLAFSMMLSSCDVNELLTDALDGFGWGSSDTPTASQKEETTSSEDVSQDAPNEFNQEELYNRALALLEKGEIEEAYDIFLTIKEYADVSEYLSRFSYKYTTNINYNNVSPDEVDIYIRIYNEYGNPLVEQNIFTATQNYYTYSYQYDDNQNLILEKCEMNGTLFYTEQYGYDEENRPVWRLSKEGLSTVEYDDAGNVIKRVSEYTGTTVEYLYDAQQNLMQETHSYDGEVTLITKNEYNDKGQLVKTIMNLCPGESVITYTYDEKGNLLLEDKMQSNGINIRHEYQYDERGNRIQTSYYSSLSNVGSDYYWEYDERGNVTKETHEVDGETEYVFSSIYDQSGNCIQITREYVLDDCVFQTDYEYDSKGNLLKVISGYRTVEYMGYKLYYNPYSNVSFEDLDLQIGK